MPARSTELTPRQARFVDEYLIDLNATQAAIRAGYSEKGASVRGTWLLANSRVKAAVEASKAALLERTEGTQERVIEKLWRVHDASMGDKPLIAKDGSEWGAQFNPAAANKSLELIGKHGGM